MMISGSNYTGTTDVNGVRLEGGDGGAGSIGWLHNFNADAIVGAAVEYQTVADSHWTLGALSFNYGRGAAETRSNFYVDGRKGSGRDDVHSFTYGTYTVGLIQNITRQFSVLIEDKQIDVDTTHGNLPKLGMQYLWSLKLLTQVSYSHSVSPDLGTRLWATRADYYGKHVNLIFGGAAGQATPAVVDPLQVNVTIPGLTTREVFVGVTKPFSRFDVTLLGDYLEIGDIERFTLTLNGMVRLGSPPR